jgi:hypothetical protein
MRYAGNNIENISVAMNAKDHTLLKDMLLDEIAFLIKDKKQEVISALQSSGVNISPSASVQAVINAVAENIYTNTAFKNAISQLIAENTTPTHSNSAGAIVGAVGQSISSVFGFATEKQRLKTEQEQSKQKLYEKLLGGKKTNYMPIIVVGGVLIIGAIVLIFTLKQPKTTTK